jgi:hypothetical protein
MNEDRFVWRAIFMALGLNAMLLGGECFVLDRIELSKPFTSIVAGKDLASAPAAGGSTNTSLFQNSGYQYPSAMGTSSTQRGRTFRPREWMPWSLLAVGAVIVMYTSAYAGKPA